MSSVVNANGLPIQTPLHYYLTLLKKHSALKGSGAPELSANNKKSVTCAPHFSKQGKSYTQGNSSRSDQKTSNKALNIQRR